MYYLSFCLLGDPRRPYPLDFVMRRGVLGQISQQSQSGIGSDDELSRSRHSSVVDDQSLKPNTTEPQNEPYNIGKTSLSSFYLAVAFY